MIAHAERRPIRVMHVVEFLALAGMEYGVIKIVNRLDPCRFEASICCLSHQVEITKQVLNPRIRVFSLNENPTRNWGLIVELARLFREQRIDVVHSHNWQTYLYAVLGARLAGVPVVIHGEHGHDSQAPSRRRLELKRRVAALVDHFVAVSDDLARELVQEWRLRPERLTPIANGVDLDTFLPDLDGEIIRKEFGLEPKHRVILNVGGLRRVKDHPTLIRALERILPTRPETRLLIVGSDFYREVAEEIGRFCRERGMTDQIIFAGTRRDIPEILAAGDVYVNSSTFEGMSNTILEAMAMAKPVVATAVGGNVELVVDGVTGFLVPAGDDAAMAAKIEAILADPSLARTLGAAGRRRVGEHHAMARMIREYSDLYEETVERVQTRRTALRSLPKRVLARGLVWSGSTAVQRAATPPPLRILTYHRILPLHESKRYAFRGMVLPRDEFDCQMAHLVRHYVILPLGEALERFQARTLPARSAVITFDDGYRDNFEYAFPIMKRYGVPATLFLVTDCLDRRERLWWDEVADGLARLATQGGGSGLPDEFKRVAGPKWHERPGDAATAIVSWLNGTPQRERHDAIAPLRVAAGTSPADERGLMMTWDDAREMSRGGMSFGTHSKSHAFLDEMEPAEILQELELSSRRLNEELGAPARWLAYPRGRALEQGQALLEHAAIEAAVTSQSGLNGPGADLFALRRLDAGFAHLDVGFDAPVFEAELAGAMARLRGA